MMKLFEARVNRTLLCHWLNLPRSVYYYQPQTGTAGAKPSQTTMKLDGSWVDNQQVVVSSRQLLNVEFNALGYEYVTYELKKEYLINKKKVYRLMKENNRTENSYIEAFHSILEHDVIERNVFDSYYEAKEMLARYFSHYNRTGGPVPSTSPFDWFYDTAAKVGGSRVGL